MSKKGMSLPINLIVVLSIAILVMVVVAAMFVLYSGKGGTSISDNVAWGEGCNTAKQRGCLVADFQLGTATSGLYIANYDPSGDDTRGTNGVTQCTPNNLATVTGCSDDTLYKACQNFHNDINLDPAACRLKCCG